MTGKATSAPFGSGAVYRLVKGLCRTTRREVIAAGLLAFVLFFVGSAALPLIGRDEPRFAQAAREMLDRGELVVPTFGGLDRYDKPILIYWCTIASYAAFGVNEGAARLPSHLAAALAVALLAFSARRRWGSGTGLLAGMLLALTVTFHVQARGCTADQVMFLPALAAMLALEGMVARLGDDQKGRGGVGTGWALPMVFWAGLALAILAKGPVAPAFAISTGLGAWALARRWPRWQAVAAILLVALGWWRLGPVVLVVPAAAALWQTLRFPAERRILARLRLAWGVPLLLALTAPWAVAAYRATDGAFFRVGVGRHVVERSLSALESHGGFPGFYLVTGFAVALPWFALLPGALRSRWAELRARPGERFLLAWLLGPLVMIELVQTKLVHYWMLSYPAAILLVVGWLLNNRTTEPRASGPARGLMAAGGLLLAAVPVVVVLRLDLKALLPLGLIAALPLVLATLYFVVRAGRSLYRPGLVLLGATAAYLVLLLALFLPALAPYLAGPRAAQRATELVGPGERILVYKARDDELFFYLPLDTINCRPRKCLAEAINAGPLFLGLARDKDLTAFEDEFPHLSLERVDMIDGVELGRVRWARLVLFRPR